QHHVAAGGHRIPGLGLVRVELLDPTRAQGRGQARRQAVRQRRIAAFAAGLDEMAGDAALVLARQAQGEAGAVRRGNGQRGTVERGQGGECRHGCSIVERRVVRGWCLNVCDAMPGCLSASGWRSRAWQGTIGFRALGEGQGMGTRMRKSMRALCVLALGMACAHAQAETWRCFNDVEVACTWDGCSIAADGGFTPMDLAFSSEGGVSLCAYTGCWDGSGDVVARLPFLVIAARQLPWSDPHGGPDRERDVLIAFDPSDRVALVKAGAWALPLHCRPGDDGGEGTD